MNAARTYRAAGDAYRVQDVSTAGPGQLVVLLYDGALDAIAKAERALVQSEAGDDGRDRYTTAHDQLSRAQAILTELQLSLDHDLGGEIAGPLDAIYRYGIERLVAANVAKDARLLPEVQRLLTELRDAFAYATTQASSQVGPP